MDRGDCVVLIFVKNFGDPGANGKDLTGAGRFEIEISNGCFLYGSQVLHETVRLSLVKSAIHIYTVILLSLLSRAALCFCGPRIQLLHPVAVKHKHICNVQ